MKAIIIFSSLIFVLGIQAKANCGVDDQTAKLNKGLANHFITDRADSNFHFSNRMLCNAGPSYKLVYNNLMDEIMLYISDTTQRNGECALSVEWKHVSAKTSQKATFNSSKLNTGPVRIPLHEHQAGTYHLTIRLGSSVQDIDFNI